jgi:hypothetical protein
MNFILSICIIINLKKFDFETLVSKFLYVLKILPSALSTLLRMQVLLSKSVRFLDRIRIGSVGSQNNWIGSGSDRSTFKKIGSDRITPKKWIGTAFSNVADKSFKFFVGKDAPH